MYKNIINIKRILITLIIFLISLICIEINVNAASTSLNVSASNTNINIGNTSTITITGTGITGKVNITSSDSNVISVSKSSEWVENGSVTVTATAKSSGTANIKIDPVDISNSETGESLSIGAKTVTITVKAPETTNNNNNSGSSNSNNGSNTGTTTTTATTTTTTNNNTSKSSDATLKSLTVSQGALTPAFSKNTTSYKVTVESNVSSIVVKAVSNDSNAKVTGTGTKELKEGTNTIKIVVTAENGTTKTYKISVVKKADSTSNENQVNSVSTQETVKLGLSKLSIEGFNLNPEFKTDVYEYTLDIKDDITTLPITATANSNDATVEITGNENLVEGENIITILVKPSGEGETSTYQIKVNKKAKQVAEVTNGDINNYDLSKDTKLYNIKKYIIIGSTIFLILLVIIVYIILKRKKDKNKFYDENELDDLIENKKSNILDETIIENDNSEEIQKDITNKRGKHF